MVSVLPLFEVQVSCGLLCMDLCAFQYVRRCSASMRRCVAATRVTPSAA